MNNFFKTLDVTNANFLIIDPQVDFHKGGSLAVVGADTDSTKIAKFIETNYSKLNAIFVTLDTHTMNHIGHTGYWEVVEYDEYNNEVLAADQTIEFYTTFTVDENSRIVGTYNNNTKYFKPKRDELKTWTIKYIKELPSYNKGSPLIWPNHCIETGDGHRVFSKLKTVLDSVTPQTKVEYYIKGQNEATEMYSIFKAEIPIEEVITYINPTYYTGSLTTFKNESKINIAGTDVPDGVFLNTKFNKTLYNSLTTDGYPILICGEALSHCVNWSLRDLVAEVLKDNNTRYVQNNKLIDGKIILLIDASSPVSGFENNVNKLLTFCLETNVSIRYLLNGNIIEIVPGTFNPLTPPNWVPNGIIPKDLNMALLLKCPHPKNIYPQKPKTMIGASVRRNKKMKLRRRPFWVTLPRFSGKTRPTRQLLLRLYQFRN